jgi:hypothetical protein
VLPRWQFQRAGHGFNDGPNYRFLATNAEWEGSALRGSTVVPWYVLQEAVEAAKGRRILFIDTCHSGNAYNQRQRRLPRQHHRLYGCPLRPDGEAVALDDRRLEGLLPHFWYLELEFAGLRPKLAPRRESSVEEALIT